MWTCKNCWNGLLRTPVAGRNGKGKMTWRDQGIDIFLHDYPVRRAHRCTFANLNRATTDDNEAKRMAFARMFRRTGEWEQRKVYMERTVYEDALKAVGVIPGEQVPDRGLA